MWYAGLDGTGFIVKFVIYKDCNKMHGQQSIKFNIILCLLDRASFL